VQAFLPIDIKQVTSISNSICWLLLAASPCSGKPRTAATWGPWTSGSSGTPRPDWQGVVDGASAPGLGWGGGYPLFRGGR
jgi:hypothetical protein